MLGAEVQPEAFVQRLDDPRERLQLLPGAPAARLAPGGFERPRLPFQRDPAAAGLLDAERLHVDVLLDLPGELFAAGGQQAPEVPGEDVELFQVGVGERQHLREERVQAYVVGELAAEAATLVGVEIGEAPARRFQRCVEPVLGRPGVEVHPGEGPDVVGREHAEVEQPVLNLVEEVGVGLLREQGGLVVRLEGLLDLVGLVGEVEHHRALLAGVSAVQAGERLDGVDAPQLLVHVHRVEQRLVEAGLELAGDHQEAILRLLELGRRLPIADDPILSGRVHAGLGVRLAAVLHRSGEGDERLPGMALLAEVAVQSDPGAHRVQARARHDHRLGPSADLAGDLRGEVLHADGDLLADGVRVQLDERLEQVLRLALVVARVVLDLLQQAPVGLVGRVAREHVEDEPLLDRLAHGVAVEGLELPVGAFPAEELQGLGLRGGREGERREVRLPPAAADLLDDPVLDLLLRGFGARFLPLGLLQAPRREHRLEALRALAGLRRMRLVDDHGEALAGKLADLLGDDGELLQRGDDDRAPRFQGLAELPRGVLDVLHHAEGLLELPDGALELAVEHAAVGHHHDRVEDAPVVAIVQHREPVGEPGDGEALAAAGRVLDQVALAGAVVARVAHEPAHAVELLVAGEDQEAPAGLAPAIVLYLHLVDELTNEVEDAVPGPDPLPQVVGGEARPGGRDRRVPGAAEASLIERQEAGLRPGERRRHEHLLRVHGEVGEAARVPEERLARVAVVAVLPDSILDVLAVERALELGREDGNAVQEEHEVEALLALLAEAELADDGEEVGRVQALRLLVQPARRPEVREPELAAGVLDAVAQHVERPPPGDLAREPAEEARLDVGPVVLLQLLPLLRLGGQKEVDDVGREQAQPAVVVLRPALAVAAGQRVVTVHRRRLPNRCRAVPTGVGAVAEQGRLDRFLERAFGDVRRHRIAVGQDCGGPLR